MIKTLDINVNCNNHMRMLFC